MPMCTLTCLTVNPGEPAGEILAELEERLAQVRAIATLARSASQSGYVNDLDGNVLGAIDTLAGQAELLLEAQACCAPKR